MAEARTLPAPFRPYLTRHAIQRYRERVADVPPEEVCRRVLTEKVRTLLSMGALYVDEGDYVVIAKNGAVTTITPQIAYNDKARTRKWAKGRRKASRKINRSKRF